MRGPKLPCLQPPLDLVLIFIILNMIPRGGLVFIFRLCIPVRVGLFYWKPCSYISAWHFLTLFVPGDSWVMLRGRDGPSLKSLEVPGNGNNTISIFTYVKGTVANMRLLHWGECNMACPNML